MPETANQPPRNVFSLLRIMLIQSLIREPITFRRGGKTRTNQHCTDLLLQGLQQKKCRPFKKETALMKASEVQSELGQGAPLSGKKLGNELEIAITERFGDIRHSHRVWINTLRRFHTHRHALERVVMPKQEGVCACIRRC